MAFRLSVLPPTGGRPSWLVQHRLAQREREAPGQAIEETVALPGVRRDPSARDVESRRFATLPGRRSFPSVEEQGVIDQTRALYRGAWLSA